MRNIIMAALMILFSINDVATAIKNDIFEIETEGRYQMEVGSSADLAKKVALFSAKRKAIELAGRYLSRKSLIVVYELDRDEIYSFAAREIQSEILEEKLETAGKTTTYRLRIRARIQSSDYFS